MSALNSGTILAANLTNLDGVDLNLDSTGTLATEQMTTYTNGEAQIDEVAADFSGMTDVSGSSFRLINGGTANLDNAANIDGASFFVSGGVTLSLPSASSFTIGDEFSADNFFRAEGAGSVLDLSNLNSLEGSSQPFSYLFVEALEGGFIDLSGTTEITGPAGGSGNRRGIQIEADGLNSQVDLSSLGSFSNSAADPDSSLSALNSGTILAANLTNLDGVDLTSDNSILSFLALTTYSGNNLAQALNSGTLNLNNLASVPSGILTVRANGLGSVVNVANIGGLTEEEVDGGVINLL